jgi:hypothetical protein
LASNLPRICAIQYNISRIPGNLVGLYNRIKIAHFAKQTSNQNVWPSQRVDNFCKMLLDDSVCPMIHTIGSDICTGWDILFRPISRRNAFGQLATAHQRPQPEGHSMCSLVSYSTSRRTFSTRPPAGGFTTHQGSPVGDSVEPCFDINS